MTAVEWLIEQLEGDDSKIARVIGLKKYNQVVSQAKQMEKQQIIDASERLKWVDYSLVQNGEQYYNETYGSENKQ